MGLLEDLNTGKYNLILFSILFILAFHQYWSKQTNESMTDVSPDIKDAIKQIYNADVEAIRNLSNVATQLQAGGLVIPGDLAIKGKLTVSGTTTTNDLVTNGPFNLIPPGTIVAFNAVTAPPGWALCDGTNGTPDLRGRFIRMASTNLPQEDGATKGWTDYVVGRKSKPGKVDPAIIGNSRVDANSLIFKMDIGEFGGTDHHSLSVNEMPPHAHGYLDTYWMENNGWDRSYSSNPTKQQGANGNDGDNYPLVFARTTDLAGGILGHNNMPPYYVLSYIMKL